MHFDWDNFFYGMTFLGIVAHAVNTFPTPKNQYGQWILGIVKFGVGQRAAAANAIRGNDTVSIPVAQGTGAIAQALQSKQGKVEVAASPENITIKEDKTTVIPTGHGTGTGE